MAKKPKDDKFRSLAYQQVANGLRHQVLTGKYPPGTRLPTTHQLAKIWKSSYFTIYTALTTLVKQGWLERVRGLGTYVAQPEKRFGRVGIYHAISIWSDQEAMFARQLNQCLIDRLRALKKTTSIFVETRPDYLRGRLLPDLAEAIFNRRVQCLIAASVDAHGYLLFPRLSLPVAMMGSSKNSAVHFDDRAFIQGSVQRLAEQGCRSLGVISNATPMDPYFVKAVRAAGLKTRKEWIIHPVRYRNPLTEFGYRAFQQLHHLSERPDGLIVYPDVAARGTILAVLQSGLRVPDEMKFVFHGNAHIRLVCPFPVTWAVSDEDAVAAALIRSIEKQFAGESSDPVGIRPTFESDDGTKWLPKFR